MKEILHKWYFKDGIVEISPLKIWQDCCSYLYLPRLCNEDVLKRTIQNGVMSGDFFGFAAGKEGDKYLDFSFEKPTLCQLNTSSLLIEINQSKAYQANLITQRQKIENSYNLAPENVALSVHEEKNNVAHSTQETVEEPVFQAQKNRFYGTVSLDPIKAKGDFATIIDEVVEHFTSQLGVKVKIDIEITASNKDGFTTDIQRIIKENCNSLQFELVEFESEI